MFRATESFLLVRWDCKQRENSWGVPFVYVFTLTTILIVEPVH